MIAGIIDNNMYNIFDIDIKDINILDSKSNDFSYTKVYKANRSIKTIKSIYNRFPNNIYLTDAMISKNDSFRRAYEEVDKLLSSVINTRYSRSEIKYMIEKGDLLLSWIITSVYFYKAFITPFHLQLMFHRLSQKDTLTMAFRGSGKSFILTESFSLTLLLKYRGIKLRIVSVLFSTAVSFSKSVYENLVSPECIAIFGNLVRGKDMGKGEVTLKPQSDKEHFSIHGCLMPQIDNDPNLSSAGIRGGGGTGYHPHIILLDDPTDELSANSERERDKTHNVVFSTFKPSLHKSREYEGSFGLKTGAMHITSTPYHSRDLSAYAEESGSFKTLKIPVLIPVKDKKGKPIIGDDGKVLMKPSNPMMKDYDEIEEDKKSFPINHWKRQFMMEMSESDGNVFSESDIKKCEFNKVEVVNKTNRGRTIKEVQVEYYDRIEREFKRETVTLLMMVDIGGAEEKSDYTAISLMGISNFNNFDKVQKIFFIDLDMGKYTTDQIEDSIAKMFYKWEGLPFRVLMERNGPQAHIVNNTAKRFKNAIPIAGITTVKNKELKIEALSVPMKSGTLFINTKMNDIDLLYTEMLDFPNGANDDGIDSFAIGYDYIMQVNQEYYKKMAKSKKKKGIIY